MTRAGAGVVLMPLSQHGQAYLTRFCWITRICYGRCTLLAHLHADFDQSVAVARADALGFWWCVANRHTRQCRVERLAPTLLVLVIGDTDLGRTFTQSCQPMAPKLGSRFSRAYRTCPVAQGWLDAVTLARQSRSDSPFGVLKLALTERQFLRADDETCDETGS